MMRGSQRRRSTRFPEKESLNPRSRAYQEQITGHSVDDAYWVGGMSTRAGGVKFDDFRNDVLLEVACG